MNRGVAVSNQNRKSTLWLEKKVESIFAVGAKHSYLKCAMTLLPSLSPNHLNRALRYTVIHGG